MQIRVELELDDETAQSIRRFARKRGWMGESTESAATFVVSEAIKESVTGENPYSVSPRADLEPIM